MEEGAGDGEAWEDPGGYQELPTAEGCVEPPRVQAGGGGGSRSPPLPAHGPALQSPPAGHGQARRGWKGRGEMQSTARG